MNATNQSWKRVSSQRIRHLTPAQCLDIIHAINARGATIFHPEIKELTGGFISQTINFMVVRKLARKAGLCK